MDTRKFAAIASLALAIVCWQPAYAQDDGPGADPTALPPEIAADFDARISELESLKHEVDRLARRAETSDRLLATVFSARFDVAVTRLFDDTVGLVQDVTVQADKGIDVSRYLEVLLPELRALPDTARQAMARQREQIRFPGDEMPTAERVVADQKLLRAINEVDSIFGAYVRYVEVAEITGLDASAEREQLSAALLDSAANRSVYLHLALEDVEILRGAVSALPDNTELPGRLNAAEARIRIASKALQDTIALMNRLDLDTREYRQLILRSTGELTTDVLDVGIVASIAAEWSQYLYDLTKSEGPRLLFRVLLIAVILVLFVYGARLVEKGITHALSSSKVNLSNLLKRMIVSSARNLVVLLGILFALSQVGVSIGPLLAGLGIAGFILGFALQDSLSNFASGLMILIYRPFDVGDFVTAGGVTGKVDHMSLVNTTFKTLDNQVLVVPNNMIWQTVITNLTAQTTRRVDLTFGISYKDDIDKAKSILRDVAANYDRVLDEPEVNIRVSALSESSVDLILRPWVRTDDYWETYWDLTEIVKKRFDEEGITIPFPQREVHVTESR